MEHTQSYRLVGTLSEGGSGDYCPATSSLLTKVRMHPRHATTVVRALLMLTRHQVARCPMISPQ
ncbi:hypothetical protein SM007_28135 [Streptomyces avermitilis]|uniref:Uncharacterized protein n=1 Tax=Streptomyces avermitilis TaxID=33903 RepID=A0A4D4MAG5_STRAX|nr:hypothetical protein [Streptomyces avermitilis]OOV24739.1 hypothetical protein SM007_28135 [Streptomyces avermitilis]GDY68865.1 hypothetical protein SAV14893_082580 [Streptomyces avermitilis]GDY70753.1 hypothetical protein SAV31267_002380 [Streptomyces avermitilis]